jgi:hypothetical protein
LLSSRQPPPNHIITIIITAPGDMLTVIIMSVRIIMDGVITIAIVPAITTVIARIGTATRHTR